MPKHNRKNYNTNQEFRNLLLLAALAVAVAILVYLFY